jgi:cyclic pyranopterin phosphate synthase
LETITPPVLGKEFKHVENYRHADGVVQNLSPLTDKFGRTLTYLRLAVTERCNLRCTYCMPESGIQLQPKDQILTYEELLRLVDILIHMGVKKIRVTGGEPMIRKGIIPFLRNLSSRSGKIDLHMTSNGFWSQEQLDIVSSLNLAGVNLSLDTLQPERFKQITRRDAFERVWKTLSTLLDHSIPLKINSVIQRGVNDDEIVALSKLAETHALDIRFIEEMPFNGGVSTQEPMSATEINAILASAYPSLKKVSPPGSIATLYDISGFKGRVGIIAGYSRTFCDACSRLRITATGRLKSCLYEGGGFDLRSLLRDQHSDESIAQAIAQVVQEKARDGFEAEADTKTGINASMSTIGG